MQQIYLDRLAQHGDNSSANALELPQYCTKSSISWLRRLIIWNMGWVAYGMRRAISMLHLGCIKIQYGDVIGCASLTLWLMRTRHMENKDSGAVLWLLLLTWFNLWISNYTPSKVWDEITYPFLNFKKLHSTLYNACHYLSVLGLKLIHASCKCSKNGRHTESETSSRKWRGIVYSKCNSMGICAHQVYLGVKETWNMRWVASKMCRANVDLGWGLLNQFHPFR